MVVVDAQYVEPYTVDLAVQRKSGSNANGNFTVVDVNGNLMFKIKDTRFSFHDRHILYDATEKPILTFKKKIRSIHGRWQAFKGDSTAHKDLLFNVKKSLTPRDETDLDVFLVENKEESLCDCKVLGNWETKSCNIYAQDCSTVLAEVHEKQNIMNVEHGKDTFGITVYPEVDYVFIVALVVILTEIKCYDGSNKKKKRKKKEKINIGDDEEKLIAKTNDEVMRRMMKKGDNDEGSQEEEEDDDNDETEDEDDESYDDDSSYDDDNCDEGDDNRDEEDDKHDEDDDDRDEDDDNRDEDDDSKIYEEEPRYDDYDDNDEDKECSSTSSEEDESRDEDRKSS